MRRHLITSAKPTTLLLVLIYLLGTAPVYCAQCFTAAAMQAPSDNQTTVMVAARCPCDSQVSSIRHSFSAVVNTAKASPHTAPVAGPVVALLDVTESTSTWQFLSDHPQFRPLSRVLNYGVRLE